jgi:hypothetical protein
VIRGRRGSAPSIDLSGWDEAEIAAGYRRLLISALSGRLNGGAAVSTGTTGRFVPRPAAPAALRVGEPDSGTRA